MFDTGSGSQGAATGETSGGFSSHVVGTGTVIQGETQKTGESGQPPHDSFGVIDDWNDPVNFGGGPGGADAFEKNCPACTMLNPVEAAVCSMCTTKF